MNARLTLATSTGLPLIALAFHVTAGTVGLVSGTVAIAARKGGAWHRRSGLVFVYAIIAMGLTAVGISLYEGKEGVAGGALTVYLVITAWTAVRPFPEGARRIDIALALLGWALAAEGYALAFMAFGKPHHTIDGVPVGMQIFVSTVILFAAVGDVRMILAGALKGSKRLARHLWRMCFGLFIATGSFVAQLVRMTWIPHFMRSLPVILILSAGPLVVLVYWMWRVRLRQNLRGLLTARAEPGGIYGPGARR